MSSTQGSEAVAEVRVENVGGIDSTDVAFSPGVTLLVGRNATNRTSFLQAIMAALGSDHASIKGDTDEATVELTLDDESYTRQLMRRSGGVVTDGDPYLEDSTLADLFAFLLESNEARQAVARGDDLREIIMRPVDTERIELKIEQFVEERQQLGTELEEIESLKRDLPGLEDQRSQLRSDIEEKEAALDAKESELQSADADVEESREEKAELEEKLEELRSKRSELDDTRYELETEKESLASLERERTELEAEREGLSETPAGDITELEAEIERLRDRKQDAEADLNELQSVIGFNEDLLDEAGSGMFADLTDDRPVTDELLDDEVVCWTCGSDVTVDQIESTLGRLRETSREMIADVTELEERIAELTSERSTLEEVQRERNRIDRRLRELEGEIEETEATIERLKDERDTVREEIAAVEETVEELEDESYSEILDLHKEANQIEYELGRLENELERTEANISQIESRIGEHDDVERQMEEVTERIEDLRTKIERIEAEAVEQFNEHMDTVLTLLDYTNLDRVWLERVERESREGRRKVTKEVFELHVIRSTESGAAYEDTVDHLSESEREVTGLVFALAGYLAHEVYDVVPFVILDSLEAIDSERIAILVDYLAQFADYLVVALLSEDAAALDDSYERVTSI